MKRPVPTILLVCSAACALLLGGCGTRDQHARAIQTAIENYTDYYIEVYDLAGQVGEQYRQLDSLQGAIDYTITVDIPNYSAVDPGLAGFTAPATDYAAMSAAQYRATSAASLRASLEAYALDNAFSTYVELPVTFSLTDSGRGLSAAMSQTSRNDIKTVVDGMVNSLLSSCDGYTQNLRLSSAADARFTLLKSLFGGDYAALTNVLSVSDNKDGTYTLSLSYPDPYDVFAALAQQYYDSFNQPFYGDARTAVLSADDLSGVGTADMATAYGDVIFAFDETSGAFSLSDASAVETQIASAKSESEAAATSRVNEEWRVPEVEAPSNGAILEGTTGGNQIVFVSDVSLGKYYYVRFYLLPGDDADEEGTLAAGVFIVGGKKATIHLPSGYYSITCYVGDAWYGLDALFGPDGTSFDGGNAVRSRSGYINTISFE